jgi:ElaB/YqjD/DUF883 family membrane-anchored ribosome-binding protein
VRSLAEIKDEIDRLADRRAQALQRLAETPDAELAHERRRLDARIAELWDEQRMTRATIRFGSRTTIVKRARRAERILRDPRREGSRAA